MSRTDTEVDDLPVDTEALLSYLADVEGGEEAEEGLAEDEVSVYYTEDFISGARISENGTVPIDIFVFQYPFLA